jgi:hypothetical protein
MKTIPIPTERKPRTRSKVYNALAVELRKLPAGQAMPFVGNQADCSNLYHSMEARGLAIRTAKIADGQYAVWISDDSK